MKFAVSITAADTISQSTISAMGPQALTERERSLFIKKIKSRYKQSRVLSVILAIVFVIYLALFVIVNDTTAGRIAVAIFMLIVIAFAEIIRVVTKKNEKEEYQKIISSDIQKVKAEYETSSISRGGRYSQTKYLIKVRGIERWYSVGLEYFRIKDHTDNVRLHIYSIDMGNGYCKTFLVTEY